MEWSTASIWVTPSVDMSSVVGVMELFCRAPIGRWVTVVPSSTSAAPARSRLEVTIAGTATRLLVDQVCSIDVGYLVGDPVDYLTSDDMTRLDSMINNYLGIGPG